tara:strand:+ start:93 stop:446 length:354 start_codon:yes stop_codon:yes gene_type:complete
MKYYPEFEIQKKMLSHKLIGFKFKTHVRIKFKKKWYDVLVSNEYQCENDNYIEFVNLINRFLKECLFREKCIVLSEKFIFDSNERLPLSIVESQQQLSNKKIVRCIKSNFFNTFWQL